MNNFEFERLTAAEKLNNSKYRSLIYRTYPNEPTCGCKSAITEQSTNTQDIDNHKSNKNFLVCPGGCKKSCCSRTMHSRITKNQDNDERMRGGGGVEEENCKCNNWRITECFKNVEDARQRGERFKDTSNDDINDYHELRTHFLSSKFCHPIQVSKSNNYQCSPFSDCTCLKNEEALKSLESYKEICTEKKCIPAKCLTRKLEEAQEFFDSSDKALDPPGLHVIDSSKSPHCRAFEEQEKLVEMSRRFSTQSSIVNPQCGKPCYPAIKSISTSPWINATPFTIAVPGRDGIVQEAIIPGAYRKDNYKTGEWSGEDETGPCKESMCRARRKKTDRERSLTTVNTETELNTSKEKKSNDNRKKKQLKLRRRKRQMISSSPSDFRSKNKPRKIRYVYLRGEKYPKFIYGHKNCNDRLERVPPNMGWFWTRYEVTGRMKPRVGWKPGAISRQIREIIKDVKDGLIEKKSKMSLISSTDMRGKKLKSKSAILLKKGHSKKLEEKEEHEPPATLHIQRREGVYYVTMYPIKKKDTDIPQLDEPIKPFQLKINTKKNNSSVATSSTVSDMEIEFLPPAAVNRYRRKPNVVHIETQVKQQEIINAFKPAEDKKKEKKGKKNKKFKVE
ncbi:uncharacterized protein [Chelonus insularis]|uniref:uncharacterized protein isoform X2 n=1 Tax=Chelonus insularis TaxID=460826 RepID=UPI00158CB093|nr:uncharacterized protein LOC118064499 isoform X2 [Chelonus insularis]